MQIITRQEAKEQGLKRYFTGKPCKHGHIAERSFTAGCVACKEGYHEAHREEVLARKKDYYQANREEKLARQKIYYKANLEKVRARQKAWCEANRESLKAAKKVYYETNREAILKRTAAWNKAWYAANREAIRESRRLPSKAWREANREKCIARSRAYRLANREKIAASQKAYSENNLGAKTARNIRRRIREAIRVAGATKSAKAVELLGASIEEVRAHLEAQFKLGMTWDNWSTHGWHVDHIKPCASFDLTDPEQQKACFHYTNLQPLWAKDNHSKSDRLDWVPAEA